MHTSELPAVVLERYSTRQSVCFCGVLPEIGRGWATVDNALFLWRFDVPDDVPVEYSGEEQAIVAVGLARPKPGVFLEAIERVLVAGSSSTRGVVYSRLFVHRVPGTHLRSVIIIRSAQKRHVYTA